MAWWIFVIVSIASIPLAGELAKMLIRGFGAYHDDGAGAVSQRDNPDGNALIGQVHHQRRQHVRCLDATGHERFLDLRPAVVLAELVRESPGRAGFFIVQHASGHTGHRQRQIACDRQRADHQLIGFFRRTAEKARRDGGSEALKDPSARQKV